MSTIPAAPLPHRPATPEATSAPHPPKRGFLGWLILLGLIAMATGGYWVWTRQAEGAKTQAVPLRSAAVSAGTLEFTVRLTGVTAAENFVSLISPQLRGSRSGMFGRQGSNFASGVDTTPKVTSNTNKSNASPGASAGAGVKSAALTAATTRSGGGTAGSAPPSSGSVSSAASGAASAAMGADGMGSTSGSQGTGFSIQQMMAFGGEFSLSLLNIAKSGMLVKKGDTVAEFDRQYMQNRLDDYRASVQQSDASYRKLLAELEVGKKAKLLDIEKARVVMDKAKLDLKTAPVLGEMDVERLKLAFESAEANYKMLRQQLPLVETAQAAIIKNAQIDLEQGKIELRRAEQNVDRMIVKAPIGGLTVIQNVFRGSEFTQIQQGDTLFPGQFFMQIVDTRSMVVNATINQVDAERLRIGGRARVRFDAYPGLELPGHIMSVGGLAKGGGARESYVKELPVRIKLDKVDPRVIPDLSVSADVILDREESAALVPASAVFQDESGAPDYVFVQGPQGWTRRDVETGRRNHTTVAVRNGLKPGEIVAIERPPAAGGV